MAKIALIPAQYDHMERVARLMRPADRDEAWACTLTTPAEAIYASLAASQLTWSGMVENIPIFISGVAASPVGNHGVPWMLGTPEIEDHAVSFLRISRPLLDQMLGRFPCLSNRVDARNRTSIRWLQWLGFHIHPAKPYGPFNLPFHPFVMRRHPDVRL